MKMTLKSPRSGPNFNSEREPIWHYSTLRCLDLCPLKLRLNVKDNAVIEKINKLDISVEPQYSSKLIFSRRI